jgi:hypothetical protein
MKVSDGDDVDLEYLNDKYTLKEMSVGL